MSATEDPFISPDVTVPELTVRVLGVGIVLGVLMTAANAYLGLYAGMTVSASIPAAVMSMIILRLIFNDVTILENNSVQTMASAGESLAAGVIFTVPAFLVVGLWTDIDWAITLAIALLGGWLGTMFTIALRRLFIVEEALPYPEGVACREVLVAGEEGGDGMVAILYALGIGALYGFVVKVIALCTAVEGAVEFLGTRLYAVLTSPSRSFRSVSSSAFESRRSFSSGCHWIWNPHANLRLCSLMARRRFSRRFHVDLPESNPLHRRRCHGGRWRPHPVDHAEDHHRWIVWCVQGHRWRS